MKLIFSQRTLGKYANRDSEARSCIPQCFTCMISYYLYFMSKPFLCHLLTQEGDVIREKYAEVFMVGSTNF